MPSNLPVGHHLPAEIASAADRRPDRVPQAFPGLAKHRAVYSFLADLGFRTTRGVWPLGPIREVNSPGETCANAPYLTHNLELQKIGFEIGYHNATPHSSVRDETKQALDLFKGYFGHDPRSMANHYNRDAIYWDPRGSPAWPGLYTAPRR